MILLVRWTVLFDCCPLSMGSTSWSIEPAEISVVGGGGTFEPPLPSTPPIANEDPATAPTIAAAAAAGTKPVRLRRWSTNATPAGCASGAALSSLVIAPIPAAYARHSGQE